MYMNMNATKYVDYIYIYIYPLQHAPIDIRAYPKTHVIIIIRNNEEI